MSHSASSDESVLGLIQQIKSGHLKPKSISSEDRQRCVEVLRVEGYTASEIARILQVSERTIARDIAIIRQSHALPPDASLPEQRIGELCQQAEVSFTHLRRIAREKGASAMERLMAETSAWKVIREAFEKLQSVGYLPKVPQTVVTEMYQHLEVDMIASYDQLATDLKELDRVARETGQEVEVAQHQKLFDEIQRGRLSVQVEALRQSSRKEDPHESN